MYYPFVATLEVLILNVSILLSVAHAFVFKTCFHPAAPSEVKKVGLSATAPVLTRSLSTLPPLFLSVLVSLAPEEREAMLGNQRISGA